MDPKNISITGYRYDLPSGQIAYYPLAERDASRLLIYRKGELVEDIYRNIAHYLPEGFLLVFNNTRVVEARIVFRKETGAHIEIFCLEPSAEEGGMAAAMAQKGRVTWKCLIGGASKWKPGQVLRKEIGPLVLEARWVEKKEDSFLIDLSWTPADLSFAELLHHAGAIPLPPYIHRAADSSDGERYQTIYAQFDGSVAAPTAGLHFTESIFQSLEAGRVRTAYVTLHVGAGTFLPVKAATMEQHIMHTEYIVVAAATIRALLDAKGVIPVGTTSARTIESLYWLGVKVIKDPGIGMEELVVRQWDAYGEAESVADRGAGESSERADRGAGTREGESRNIEPGVEAALTALLGWMERQGMSQLMTTTQLLITPGYDWKIVKGLITNFHQPESTLLLLIAALVGDDWRRIYTYALEFGFRFLSYGDGCLLLPSSK